MLYWKIDEKPRRRLVKWTLRKRRCFEMSASPTIIPSTVAPTVAVERVLKQNGLCPASTIGYSGVRSSHGVGILRGEPYERPNALFFKGRRRREFIGVVYFDCDRLGATKEQWVLEVYGFQNVELAERLAHEIATVRRGSISVILSSEEQEKESLPNDFSYA